jgi:hypothetical protein
MRRQARFRRMAIPEMPAQPSNMQPKRAKTPGQHRTTETFDAVSLHGWASRLRIPTRFTLRGEAEILNPTTDNESSGPALPSTRQVGKRRRWWAPPHDRGTRRMQ